MFDLNESALSCLLSQHANEQAALAAVPAVKVTITRSPNPLPKVKAKKVVVTQHKPGIPGLALPERGTLDAAGFMAAVQKAGKRMGEPDPNTGVRLPYTDPGQIRNDLICAIHAYIGYNPKDDFGTQDTAARAQALRDLKVYKVSAGPTREEQKAVARSLHGTTPGMPDHQSRHLANLLAQEARAAEDLVQFMRSGDQVREAIERERLSHIRRELVTFGQAVADIAQSA